MRCEGDTHEIRIVTQVNIIGRVCYIYYDCLAALDLDDFNRRFRFRIIAVERDFDLGREVRQP